MGMETAALTEVLGSILEVLPSPVFVKDEQHRWVLVNETFCKFMGYQRRELLGRSDRDVYGRHEADVFWSSDDVVFATGGVSENEERVTDSGGQEHVILTRKTLYTDQNGRRLLVGIITAISERKQAEQLLRASETRYRRLFEAAKDGILILDGGTGRIVDVNAFLIELTGYSHEHFLGKQLWEIGPFKDIAASRASFADLQALAYVRYDDLPLEARDGRRIDVEFVSNVYRVGNQDVIQCNIRDITARKRAEKEHRKLEEQLLSSQKLEAVGRLAGGVAHDFNNLLTVILSSATFAQESAPAGSQLREDLDGILAASGQAQNLTRQLLAFSRRQELEPRVLDLNLLVVEVEKMLRRVLGEDILIRKVLAEGLWRVTVDSGQFEQVLMNLAVNARDAMPGGGRLSIETSNVDLDGAGAARDIGVPSGAYVLLTVSDTGCGMDAATLGQVFEPFFTTKPPGKGTGLGLSTVYGIAKQSGGAVCASSELGVGTTFKLYLPRALAGPGSIAAGPTPSAAGARSGETVLVVEDNDHVRHAAIRCLKKDGYEVLAARGLPEALAAVRSHPAPIHLLLTDVIMPGGSGQQLAREIAVQCPGIATLFMSGYTDEAVSGQGPLASGALFFQKPFTPESLKHWVREALDRAAAMPTEAKGAA
jgi:two-component system, cell cycle sensor histidine kinase and response regulator CckA